MIVPMFLTLAVYFPIWKFHNISHRDRNIENIGTIKERGLFFRSYPDQASVLAGNMRGGAGPDSFRRMPAASRSSRLLPCLLPCLLLAACGTEEIPMKPDAPPVAQTDHGVPSGHEFSTFEGDINWRWDYDDSPESPLCDMWWSATGTVINACPECIWSFRLEMTLDEGRSGYAAECLGALEATDLEWRVGLVEDFYGYGVPLLMVYDTGYYGGWLPGFVSNWSYPELIWGGGWLEMPVTQGEDGAAYTNYWYGTATVQ